MLQLCLRAVQRRTVMSGGPFAHAWKPVLRPAASGSGRRCFWELRLANSRPALSYHLRLRFVLLILALFSIASWTVVLTNCGPTSALSVRPRSLSTCFGAATSSPKFRPSVDRSRQAARRPVSVWLRRIDRATSRTPSGRHVQSTRRCRSSYFEESHSGRSFPAARICCRSQQARTPAPNPRHDSERGAVHRAVRNSLGNHDSVF